MPFCGSLRQDAGGLTVLPYAMCKIFFSYLYSFFLHQTFQYVKSFFYRKCLQTFILYIILFLLGRIFSTLCCKSVLITQKMLLCNFINVLDKFHYQNYSENLNAVIAKSYLNSRL